MDKALASKIKKKATTNDLKFAINEIERQLLSLGGEDHVSAVKVLHDFADNEYAFAKFEKQGYGIFNFNNSDVVELSPFGSIPFEWYCPDCGELLCDDGYKDTYIKYCEHCGQKLDWSDGVDG